MSSDYGGVSASAEMWSVLAYHDWSEDNAIETTLIEALDELTESSEVGILYDYVDTEAVVDLLNPGSDRGATEVRFEYEGHEIRITQDGTVAVR
jgi:hypothetical protein